MTTGRKIIPLAEAVAAWRALPEHDRIEATMDVSHGTAPDSPASLALLALADAAAAEPEAKKAESWAERADVIHVDLGHVPKMNDDERQCALCGRVVHMGDMTKTTELVWDHCTDCDRKIKTLGGAQ